MRCPTVMRFPFLFHLVLPNNDNFLIALKDSPTMHIRCLPSNFDRDQCLRCGCRISIFLDRSVI